MTKINPIICWIIGHSLLSLLPSPLSADPTDHSTLGMTEKITDTQENTQTETTEGPVDTKLNSNEKSRFQPFILMAHRPNFCMVAYDTSREDIFNYGGYGYDLTLDNIELQFQVSLKAPLAIDLFGLNIDLYGAYTNRSFWQALNDEGQNSSAFRETNHEPELWLQKRHHKALPFGFHYKLTAFGFAHQSNGRGGVHALNPDALSRSWNRVFSNSVLEKGNLVVSIKPWYRVPEDVEEDDNSDITDYLGHGELRLIYKSKRQNFSLMSRNNFESGFSRGAVEVSWSFPLGSYPYFKGYVQFFTGYGESLADYNKYNNRIAIGISLSDWL